MSGTFVGPDELETLTGYKLRAYQRKWLQDRGWKFDTDRLGFPRVLRAEMERRMLGQTKRKEREVNVKALAA